MSDAHVMTHASRLGNREPRRSGSMMSLDWQASNCSVVPVEAPPQGLAEIPQPIENNGGRSETRTRDLLLVSSDDRVALGRMSLNRGTSGSSQGA